MWWPGCGVEDTPCFLYVWQGKELLIECFVFVAAKGRTDGKKWDFGAFLGCVAGNGLSSFWLVFTINGTAESEFSQWLICSKTGKTGKRLNAESGTGGTECAEEPSFVRGGLSARSFGLEGLHIAD